MSTHAHAGHGHISTRPCLRVVEIKRHLLCWHLLQSHTPPPLPHPSCHNCRNSTNTRAYTLTLFTLTHTHTTFPAHTFSRSAWPSPVGARVPTPGHSLCIESARALSLWFQLTWSAHHCFTETKKFIRLF